MAKKPKIRPLGDRVLVRRLEAEEKTAGGIVLPDAAKEKPREAEVVAVGDGRVKEDGSRVPMRLKVGDRVVFGSFAGTEVKLGDEELLILREDDVLAIIR